MPSGHNYKVDSYGNQIDVRGELSLRSFPYISAALHRITRQSGYRDVLLNFNEVDGVYPSVAAPFVSQVRYLRQEFKVDFEIRLPQFAQASQRLKSYKILNYLGVEKGPRLKTNSAEPQVFVFETPDRQFAVVDAILNATLRKISLDRSHLKAVEWAVNEITDNVLNHSQSKVGGCIIASRVPHTNIVEFCVADSGVGIAKTLGEDDDEKALELAIQEGITRNRETNQGNGLYGSFRLAQVSEATFSISSGFATLYVNQKSDVKAKQNRIPYRGTHVLCQIDCDRTDLIQRALIFDGRAHDPAFDYLEKMHEIEDGNQIQVEAKDICKTFGSRESGKEARNYIKNILQSYPSQPLCIDLSDVNIVSSSFADEVFGKLFVELGPMRYMRTLRLQNSCSEVETVIDRAITLRAKSDL